MLRRSNTRGGKRGDAASIEEETEKSDVAPEMILFTHMLSDIWAKLLEEMPEKYKKRIYLDMKTLTILYLEGASSIRIMRDDNQAKRDDTCEVNSLEEEHFTLTASHSNNNYWELKDQTPKEIT